MDALSDTTRPVPWRDRRENDRPAPRVTDDGVHATLAVSVVIPARNEEGSIGTVLRALPSEVSEVIVVDGRSTDRTVELALAEWPTARIVQQTGRGKGDALRAGFAAATGDVVVMLDADGSMDPAEILRFVAAIEAGADIAKGSRFLDGAGSTDLSLVRALGNLALLRVANRMCHRRFTDLCYGYMAFRRRALEQLVTTSEGFAIETELVVRGSHAGLDIVEVPSFERDRIAGVSALRPVKDGLRIVALLARLHVRAVVRRRSAGRSTAWSTDPALRPIAVTDVDLGPRPSRAGLGVAAIAGYDRARVLVRERGEPIGVVEVAAPSGVVDLAQVAALAGAMRDRRVPPEEGAGGALLDLSRTAAMAARA